MSRAEASRAAATSVRSVNYATSPLLARKTPPWRSRFVVALVGAGLPACCSAARSTCRSSAPTSTRSRARSASAHASSCRPAAAASSTATASCWPPACRCRRSGRSPRTSPPTPQQRKALARLLGMTPAELDAAAGRQRATSPGCAARSTSRLWPQVKALGVKGVHEVREYRRSTPRARRPRTWSASPTSRTTARKASSSASRRELQGHDGSRTVVKDRLGRVVEDVRRAGRPGQRPRHPAVDRLQGAVLRLPARARRGGRAQAPRPAAWWCSTCTPARCWRWPTTPASTPATARNLTGAQLRNRALTDIFEPGSTMKPFIAALALETGRVTPDTVIQTAPGSLVDRPADDHRRAPARRADGASR